MLQSKPTFRWINRMMDDMNRKILCVRLGHVHVIAVSDPNIALEVLKDTDWIFISREILSGARHKRLSNKRNEEDENILRYINNQYKTNDGGNRGLVDVRIIRQQYTPPTWLGSFCWGKGMLVKGDQTVNLGEEIEHADSLWSILVYLNAFCVTDYFSWLRWITDFDGHEKTITNAILISRKYQDPLIDKRIQQWKDGVRNQQ